MTHDRPQPTEPSIDDPDPVAQEVLEATEEATTQTIDGQRMLIYDSDEIETSTAMSLDDTDRAGGISVTVSGHARDLTDEQIRDAVRSLAAGLVYERRQKRDHDHDHDPDRDGMSRTDVHGELSNERAVGEMNNGDREGDDR